MFLFKLHLNIIYAFLKLFKIKNNRVVFISRQQNYITKDFDLLRKKILEIEPNYEVIVLCKKIKKNMKSYIKYYFHMYKQMYFLATSQTCVIDSYSICVSVLKHKKSLKIIQIWHALGAIKKFGYQNLGSYAGRNEKMSKYLNMHKNYDLVVSGSDLMSKYFSEAFNINISKIVSIGLPRIDYLIHNQKYIKSRIHKIYPNLNKKKVILYVPTFRVKEDVKIEELINTVDFNKYNLIIKSHPTRKFKVNSNKVYTCNEFLGLELLTVADYVITDYSAISIEAALLNKPIYFYTYDYNDYSLKNGLNINLYEEMPGCVYEDIKLLMKNLAKEKYDLNLVKKYKKKYITNEAGNSAELLARYIIRK